MIKVEFISTNYGKKDKCFSGFHVAHLGITGENHVQVLNSRFALDVPDIQLLM